MTTAQDIQADIAKQVASSTETEVGTLQVGSRVYKVMRVDGIEMIAYRLIGPKGGSYDLLRNVHNRNRFFAVNHESPLGKGTPFKNMWFTDQNRDGTPCPLRIF